MIKNNKWLTLTYFKKIKLKYSITIKSLKHSSNQSRHKIFQLLLTHYRHEHRRHFHHRHHHH